jgi:DNA-binding NarL/FixJ family response regulator
MAHTMSEIAPISVLLATPKALIRESIGLALQGEPDLCLVGQAADGVVAVGEVLRLRPRVVILERGLPGGSAAAETASVIRDRAQDTQVVVLGEADPGSAIEALDAGASAYLSTDDPVATLAIAIRAVARGEVMVSPAMFGAVLSRLLGERRRKEEALRTVLSLSERERDVLSVMVDGGTTGSIAQALGISPQTAKNHVQNILSKLRVHSRVDAVELVTANGLGNVTLRRPSNRRP